MQPFIFVDDLDSAAITAALSADIGKIVYSKHGKKNTLFRIGSGFDCETTTTKNKKMSYVYIWQLSINKRCYLGRTCGSCEKFLRILDAFLTAAAKRKTHKKIKYFPKLYIWDANLGYEWAHFKRVFERVGITGVFAKSDRHPLAINVGNCLAFRECLGLFGYSLDNIAKTHTRTQKCVGDIDYTQQRHDGTPLTKKELNYAINDVMILSELSYVAFEAFAGHNIPYTQTGVIRAEIRENCRAVSSRNLEFTKYKTRKQMPKNDDEYSTVTRMLYCGGLSHSYYKYVRRIVENVLCADLVSDFPAQMIHRKYPAGSLVGNRSFEELQQAEHWYALITFYNLRSKTGHSIISKHKCIDLCPYVCDDNLIPVEIDNGRVYRAGMCAVYCTEIDLQNIMLIYQFDDVEFCDMHTFSKSAPCPEYVTDAITKYYRAKTEIKNTKQHKGARKKEYEESKKRLNGIYGMTATRLYKNDIVFDEEAHDLRSKEKPETYAEQIENVWLSPWIAIYTTAYARNILCRLISKYPDIIIQYDTDSIYFLDGEPESEKIKAEISRHNAEMQEKNRAFFGDPLFDDLGKWEYDPPIEKMKTLGAKRYLYLSGGKYKFVCAGAKKSAFLRTCREQKKDPFEFFDRNMFLKPSESDKTTLTYCDNPVTDDITDLYGNTRTCTSETCGIIKKIPFGMYVSGDWLTLIKYLTEKEGKR